MPVARSCLLAAARAASASRPELADPGVAQELRLARDPETSGRPTVAQTMLSRAHRMRRSGDFGEVVRSGARAGSATVVVHLLPTRPAAAHAAASDIPAQFGFIVNKAVGPAVVRNRIRRRLRHQCRPLAGSLPQGTRIVVRALPAAAGAGSQALAADLESCVGRAAGKAERMVTT